MFRRNENTAKEIKARKHWVWMLYICLPAWEPRQLKGIRVLIRCLEYHGRWLTSACSSSITSATQEVDAFDPRSVIAPWAPGATVSSGKRAGRSGWKEYVQAAQTTGQGNKGNQTHCTQYELYSAPRTALVKINSLSVRALQTISLVSRGHR